MPPRRSITSTGIPVSFLQRSHRGHMIITQNSLNVKYLGLIIDRFNIVEQNLNSRKKRAKYKMPYFDSLKQLGLNQKEQDVYLAILQMEKASVNDLSIHAKTKRSTTYNIVYRLKAEGFVSETTENNKHFFVANNPELVLSVLDEKKRHFKQELPAILSLYNILPQKPKVAYFEGVGGIKQLYEDTLLILQAGDEILAYVSTDTVKHLEEYSVDYIKRRVAKKIMLRGIYNNSPDMQKYMAKNKEQMRVAKMISEKEIPLENEINIYSNKMIIITYKPEPYGILIESKEITNTQKAIFETLWKRL
ncbi:MAG: transcriptional regulator TrmB [Candidatus Berkelbacteria bacterium]|nr:transcriptional regulator TrmB [Candidatus Berkelbacteria bacterium]